jgi:hypothetical protein
MPELLSTDSKPISYFVLIRTLDNCTISIEGPVFSDNYDSRTSPGGRIQILSYGVAQWQGNRTRTVYPWSQIVQIGETFR